MNKRKVFILVSVVIILFVFIIMNFDFRLDRFGNYKISWVDCIQIDNTKYYRDNDNSIVEASLIGNKIGEVKFNVSQQVSNEKYRFRNGDATFIEVGTEIYDITKIADAIAVKIDEQYYLYKKMRN